MLEDMTAEVFSEHLNSTFQLEVTAEHSIQLELVEVKINGQRYIPPSFARSEQRPARDAFSIIFLGPPEPELIQRMYTLHHDAIGTLEGLFLVPIYRDAAGMYYQAVFN